MALKSTISDQSNAGRVLRRRAAHLSIVVSVALFAGCSELQRPKVEPFFATTLPPPKQQLRWSNGKMPKSLDPARAAAAPEADIVRAIYAGLTDLDSKSLRATAAVAEKWESSADHRTWIFNLRKDARWSNGERVTAEDFARSWKRLAAMREKAANRFLFQNIVGMQDKAGPKGEPTGKPDDFQHSPPPDNGPAEIQSNSESLAPPRSQTSAWSLATSPEQDRTATETTGGRASALKAPKFGVLAVNDSVLKVNLELPDRDFAKLVANPIFRPVYGDGSNFDGEHLDPATVTNGAFRVVKIGSDAITIEPSENHWNRKAIALESVRFVATDSPESALDAYRKGDVDVITNAPFEPLALKLLTPYEDFRRTAHGGLNFYEFNVGKAPFSDRRIREALAISIDRTKLAEGDLEGVVQPANTFNPLSERKTQAISLDVEKAKQLLEKAGYPNGKGFPPIRLIINRNDMQQRVARSVARMWQQNLNLETVIVVKETSEIDAVRQSGDFDVMRRGIVLPANDETVNMASIFGSAEKAIAEPPAYSVPAGVTDSALQQGPNDPEQVELSGRRDETEGGTSEFTTMLTEDDAIFELRAIPLYFPTSYALVKPYVRGFEMNGLDAPSLYEISIDSSWQPRPIRGQQ